MAGRRGKAEAALSPSLPTRRAATLESLTGHVLAVRRDYVARVGGDGVLPEAADYDVEHVSVFDVDGVVSSAGVYGVGVVAHRVSEDRVIAAVTVECLPGRSRVLS